MQYELGTLVVLQLRYRRNSFSGPVGYDKSQEFNSGIPFVEDVFYT